MTQPASDDGQNSAVLDDELRVRSEYARRASAGALRLYYDRVRPALQRSNEERWRIGLRELDTLGDRSGLKVLDVGCGFGDDLEILVAAGFREANLAGVDVLDERVSEGRARLPSADIRVTNAAALPFGDGTFDAVTQAVALSSVIDPDVRRRIAAEMLRVTRPGGLVISYDMAVVRDRNPHLVPIDAPELRRLFGASRQLRLFRVTLFLPIASRAPRWVRALAARVPLLRTHLLAVVRREAG